MTWRARLPFLFIIDKPCDLCYNDLASSAYAAWSNALAFAHTNMTFQN